MSQRLVVVFKPDLRLRPLASWDAAPVHNVDLAIRSTLHLRQKEVREDQADERCTTPNVTTLAANCTVSATSNSQVEGELTISASGVQHV